jgi:NDP-sugar pyrophosphorylase family protein
MQAVILAGGRGTRLAPYTTVVPKPLMPIGDMPILEVVLRQLRTAGFSDVVLALGYLGGLIRAFFDDGSRYGLRLRYSQEEKPLGTVGPLTLMTGLEETFLVMNGDTLTNLDYAALVRHHREQGAAATVATHQREVAIDFGVIECDEAGRLVGYVEKPRYSFEVSMGVYVFDRRILGHLERGRRFDFPDLVKLLLARGESVSRYAFSGYWLDIGRPDDCALAVQEFESRRDEFLPREDA